MIYINGVSQEVIVHAALTTGVHGVGSNHVAGFHAAGQALSKVIWKASSATALTVDNLTETVGFTELALQGDTSLQAKFAILRLDMRADTIGTGNVCELWLRKHGTTPAHYEAMAINKVDSVAGDERYTQVIMGLDEDQKIDYAIQVGTGWQIDVDIKVLGYIE